jgi:CubicO group peptidase (beta-lactamase class C family)
VVARRGRLVHFEAHGLMDVEANKPMARDALFRLASSTKPITAAAILVLMEEGRLKLTDPVSKFIPEFKKSKVAVEWVHTPVPMAEGGPEGGPRYYTVPADHDITIVDLLTHTSGLASNGGITAPDYRKLQQARTAAETLADFIPRLGALPLDYQPGTRWQYSALAGFDTLARIVEIASGTRFDRFLRQRIFEPLGMENTWLQVPEKDKARLVPVYRKTARGLERSPVPGDAPAVYFGGATGVTSTAADYLQFAQMLCNGGQLNGKRILSPWTVDLMLSNHVGKLFEGGIHGRPPKGMGFGLGGEVVVNAVDARLRRPDGSYGWSGAYGTYWWVNRKAQMAAVLFVQGPAGRSLEYDFDNAVSQAVIE